MSIYNIIGVYSLATQDEIEEGKAWYANARRECQELADNLGYPLAVVAGVVAALSPNNRWQRNLRDAEALLRGYRDGVDVREVKVSTYHAMRQKAWDICDEYVRYVRDVSIAQILNGPKITAFYKCILGHEDAVCIDGHAYNIAQGNRKGLKGLNVSAKDMRETASQYVSAAEEVGLKPYELQAITWVVWRRIHGI